MCGEVVIRHLLTKNIVRVCKSLEVAAKILDFQYGGSRILREIRLF
jgi:hypothetical protein